MLGRLQRCFPSALTCFIPFWFYGAAADASPGRFHLGTTSSITFPYRFSPLGVPVMLEKQAWAGDEVYRANKRIDRLLTDVCVFVTLYHLAG